MIPEGARAPDFEAPSTGGTFRLRDVLETGPLVLFFYPKASTPGCTNEVLEFEAWFNRFEHLGVRVAGCSVDSLDDQKAFSEKHGGLPFPLIADSDASIARSYEVLREDWGAAKRATAVIDETGAILKTYPDAPGHGKGHAKEVFRDVRGLIG